MQTSPRHSASPKGGQHGGRPPVYSMRDDMRLDAVAPLNLPEHRPGRFSANGLLTVAMAGWGPTVRYAFLVVVRYGCVAVLARVAYQIGKPWIS